MNPSILKQRLKDITSKFNDNIRIYQNKFVQAQLPDDIYNSLIMQLKANPLYNWQALNNFAEYLPLKDLLNTATLSKQFNLILKKYLKQHFTLPNNQNLNQFQLIRDLFNRKIYTYNQNDKSAKPNPSNLVLRNIQSQQDYSVVQTLDLKYKIIKTDTLILEQAPQMISLPRNFKLVSITQEGALYCSDSHHIYRYYPKEVLFAKEQVVDMKGQIEDLIAGYKFAIAIVRYSPQQIKLRIFDNSQPLQNYKDLETHFQIPKFKIENNLVMGNGANYFLFNETLYEFNIKSGSINLHPQFVGKKIVKIIGGKAHFIAYERVEEIAELWTNQDVIKFAQKEGFQDFIMIFKAEKVTGKILLNMDKKYMQQVLGIQNVKIQQKLALRLEYYNKEDPDMYIIYGWGRAAEGGLATNPSKVITKPIKIKLPNDCDIFALSGKYSLLYNKKTHALLVNHIDEKSNKLQWKQVTSRKVWSISTVDDSILLIASAKKEKIPQRQSEQVLTQKKQKLRTAKMIVDKITWDQNIKSEEYKVGYLDKYEGILQIPFSQLEKTEVKEYRIEYFKRGSEVVWDKKKRIDIL